jgi:membrane protein implicated in regulation of membrane protease activity
MTTWTTWAVLAVVLALLEMAGPGFFVIFFAAGAALAAVLAFLLPDLAPWVQVLAFVVASVASMLLFRRRLVALFGTGKAGTAHMDNLVSEVALPLEDLAPGATGKAELRGTVWKAHNAGDALLAKGQRCSVSKVEGLTIWLKAEKP